MSMPSWELFEKQTLFYRLNVLPPTMNKRLAIEAGVTLGWDATSAHRGRDRARSLRSLSAVQDTGREVRADRCRRCGAREAVADGVKNYGIRN